MRSAAAMSASTSVVGSLEARTGTPAAIACCLAVTLFPALRSTRAGGPMKVMPAFSAASANSGFSERKP